MDDLFSGWRLAMHSSRGGERR